MGTQTYNNYDAKSSEKARVSGHRIGMYKLKY
jgi:hypothetical protein